MIIPRSITLGLASCAAFALSTSAAATITFTIQDQSSGQGQIVLLNDTNIQATAIQGHTNQSGDNITFTSSQIIGDDPNGQALIAAFAAMGDTVAIALNNLEFHATDPLLAFSRVEFDLTNTANLGNAIEVSLTGLDQFGAAFNQTFTTHLSGQNQPVGTNWIVGTATNGEVITSVSFVTPQGTGFSDFRQLRVDLAAVTPPIPEPGTWAMMLMGFGAVGFAMRRRLRTSLPQLA